MKRVLDVAALALILSWSPSLCAGATTGSWQYLVDRLVTEGLDPDPVRRAFADPRMAPFDGLEFSPEQPREVHSRYRQFLTPATIVRARSCRAAYAGWFDAAAQHYGVPANVLASILYVETGCGRNTGSYVILHRLARLAMANEPENLRRNLERFADSRGTLDPSIEAQLRARAQYLEATFYPEVRATFLVAQQMGVSPLDLRGSPSGAFGYPQFLPTSFLQYGVDGDGDGIVSLYTPSDATASAARYLAAYGWRPGISRAQQRQVIWHYNHSDAYIDTVLALASRIDAQPTNVSTAKSGTKPRRSGTRPKKPSTKPKTKQSTRHYR